MTKRILFFLLCALAHPAWSATPYPGLQVEVARTGGVYQFDVTFDSPLSECAAFYYLTDYESAGEMPGMISSSVYRESSHKARVERIADEQVLFLHVRLRSVMEYSEVPYSAVSFTQLDGDSKSFRGNWDIEATAQGSTLKFHGQWEPDSLIPYFIIDHFAENGLINRFSAIAHQAIARREFLSDKCAGALLVSSP